MDRIKLIQAYARLTSLRTNLPEDERAQAKYVHEFHAILRLLSDASEYDLKVFKVPRAELLHRILRVSLSGAERAHIRYCDREFLLMKIDAVLTFFSIEGGPQKSKIGFRPR